VTALADLGPRIVILGPSNSGKSTLADAIGRARDVPVIHLDQLHHRPNTDWRPRPAEEFLDLHDRAIAGSRWVMDGNYRRLLPQRLDRASGAILIKTSRATSLFRYFRRSWFEKDRRGGLEGGKESVKWGMIHHILLGTPPFRTRFSSVFARDGLPIIELGDASALSAFYRSEGLDR